MELHIGLAATAVAKQEPGQVAVEGELGYVIEEGFVVHSVKRPTQINGHHDSPVMCLGLFRPVVM